MANSGYHIKIKLQSGEVTAFHGKIVLAKSDQVNILRESRLPDGYYFPREAIDKNLLVKSDRQTFCPFKGSTTYWHLKTPDGLIENGAWSYDHPLKESADIAGQISFGHEAVDHYQANEPSPFLQANDEKISSPLSDWVLRKAGSYTTRRDFVRGLGHKLVESGISLMRLRIMLWSLHPQIAGVNYQWDRDKDEIEILEPGHEIFTNQAYINSPINLVSKGLGGVRQSLAGDADSFEFPIMADLKEQGATDYVAMPLRFSDGQFNCMTLACDHRDGFTTENLGMIFECVGAISRYLEVMTLRINTTTLLNTYLGERTGQKVLAGDIRRGQGENIEAIILFSDLRNSTGMAEKLPRNEYLQLLNRYFETVLEPVNANGGEVLKFIGDAVLAIFPIADREKDKKTQAEKALKAAKIAVDRVEEMLAEEDNAEGAKVDLGISLHIGDVTYGNVGGAERLDFTVIGPAVNLASRLENLCKTSGNKIVMSQDFVTVLGDDDGASSGIRQVGSHQFAGISQTQNIFAPS